MAIWWMDFLARRDFWTERRKRLALGATLSLLGVASLIEVVAMPGSLLRRPPAVVATDPGRPQGVLPEPAVQPQAHPTVHFVDSVLEDKETKLRKAREREAAERQELKRRLVDARASLHQAAATTNAEWETLIAEVRRSQGVDLANPTFDPKTQSRELNQLIVNEDAAKMAWTRIRGLRSQVVPALQGAQAQINEIERRLADDNFAESDLARLQTALKASNLAREQIRQGQKDLNDIAIFLRGQKFMQQLEKGDEP